MSYISDRYIEFWLSKWRSDSMIRRVLESRPVRRLKDISFLGAIDYTSLVHKGPRIGRDRLHHTLGVAALADFISEHRNYDEETRNHVVVAALLHDIGHGPFSHAMENSIVEVNEDNNVEINEDNNVETNEDNIETKYIEFINLINEHLDNKIELNIDSESINNKLINYFNFIKENKKFKKYLLKRKNKLFYSDNIKLFDQINIRKILEKVDNTTSNKIWTYLQLFYILINTDNDNYTLKLINNIENNLENNKCDDLVNDIISNVKELFNDFDTNDNPLEKLMFVSQQLADKYRDDIADGKITMEDMIKYITNVFNDNEHINKDIFKDIDLSETKMNEMFSNIFSSDQLNSLKNLSNIDGNLMDGIFKNLLHNDISKNIEDKPLENDQINNMEKFFENVSTDNLDNTNITLNENEINESNNNNLDLSNLTNMLFSQINNLKNNLNESNDDQNDNKSLNYLSQLDDLKNDLMNQLSSEQKNEITNLTSTILDGFNIKK